MDDEKTDSGLLTEDARESVDPTGWRVQDLRQ